MARINIEDSLWKDTRFQDLMIKTGSRHTAKGMVLELYTEAQKYWLASGGRGIPRPAWDKAKLPRELIECGLAEDNGEFIYAIGSKDAFAWLEACSESGKKGGPAAAKARRETTAKSKRPKSSRHVETTSEIVETRPPSPSPSPSPSLTLSYSVGEDADALPGSIANPVGFFIGRYVRAYQKRYTAKARPSLTGKVQGQIGRFVDETPLDRACELIQTYCAMNDPWFLTKGHDFGTFIENLAKVGLALDTGKTITRAEINQAEDKDYYQNQLKRIAGGQS